MYCSLESGKYCKQNCIPHHLLLQGLEPQCNIGVMTARAIPHEYSSNNNHDELKIRTNQNSAIGGRIARDY